MRQNILHISLVWTWSHQDFFIRVKSEFIFKGERDSRGNWWQFLNLELRNYCLLLFIKQKIEAEFWDIFEKKELLLHFCDFVALKGFEEEQKTIIFTYRSWIFFLYILKIAQYTILFLRMYNKKGFLVNGFKQSVHRNIDTTCLTTTSFSLWYFFTVTCKFILTLMEFEKLLKCWFFSHVLFRNFLFNQNHRKLFPKLASIII